MTVVGAPHKRRLKAVERDRTVGGLRDEIINKLAPQIKNWVGAYRRQDEPREKSRFVADVRFGELSYTSDPKQAELDGQKHADLLMDADFITKTGGTPTIKGKVLGFICPKELLDLKGDGDCIALYGINEPTGGRTRAQFDNDALREYKSFAKAVLNAWGEDMPIVITRDPSVDQIVEKLAEGTQERTHERVFDPRVNEPFTTLPVIERRRLVRGGGEIKQHEIITTLKHLADMKIN